MNNQLAALSECVAHGLEDGWRQARKAHTQPTKQEWLDALYLGGHESAGSTAESRPRSRGPVAGRYQILTIIEVIEP